MKFSWQVKACKSSTQLTFSLPLPHACLEGGKAFPDDGVEMMGLLSISSSILTGKSDLFAMQDVATNFVSGVLLVLQRPFEKGDKLRVHAGSTILEGEVHSIELRYIVLKPKDHSIVMIPASIVYANPVVVLK